MRKAGDLRSRERGEARRSSRRHEGGRACWIVAATLCGGATQGSFAEKAARCQQCAFYKRVREEEGPALERVSTTLGRLH